MANTKQTRNRGSGKGAAKRRWSAGNLLSLAAIALLLGGGGYAGYTMLSTHAGPTMHAGMGLASTEDLTRGETLYAQNCAVCHGDNAEGENPLAPRGGTAANGRYLAPALNGMGHAWHHDPDGLFKVVKFGSPAQDSPMRGWADRMDDAEIRAVLAYLHSLWPEQVRSRYAQSFGTHRNG